LAEHGGTVLVAPSSQRLARCRQSSLGPKSVQDVIIRDIEVEPASMEILIIPPTVVQAYAVVIKRPDLNHVGIDIRRGGVGAGRGYGEHPRSCHSFKKIAALHLVLS